MMRTRGLSRAVGLRLKAATDTILGWLALGLLLLLRLVNRQRMAGLAGRVMRTVGPWLKEHRIGRDNLKAAFPEKSPAEIEAILAGVWDNLGRVAAEFAHIDRVRFHDPERHGPADVTYEKGTWERFHRLRDSRPAVFFAAHLANWELPAVAAAHFRVDVATLYRPPNLTAVSDAILKIRAGSMGTLVASSLDAPVRLLRALEAGRHVAMLVDQHEGKGVEVTFFGRRCKANPLIARLARLTDCPIHGVRAVRQPDGHHFYGEVTEAIEPARDAEGEIDVAGTMQVITSVVESWVREHPEQWLWLHRRWR